MPAPSHKGTGKCFWVKDLRWPRRFCSQASTDQCLLRFAKIKNERVMRKMVSPPLVTNMLFDCKPIQNSSITGVTNRVLYPTRNNRTRTIRLQ